MTNIEPTSPILRRRDVLAWLPALNPKILRVMEKSGGEPICVQDTPDSRRLYIKAAIKRRVGLSS